MDKSLDNIKNDEEYIATLKPLTGESDGLPQLPQLKFNASTGNWMKNEGNRDADGKLIWESLIESTTVAGGRSS